MLDGPSEAWRVICEARSNGVLHRYNGFRLDVAGTDGKFVIYRVVLAPHRRTKDGTLSSRLRARPVHFGPSFSPDVLLVDAAEWLVDNYPEAVAAFDD